MRLLRLLQLVFLKVWMPDLEVMLCVIVSSVAIARRYRLWLLILVMMLKLRFRRCLVWLLILPVLCMFHFVPRCLGWLLILTVVNLFLIVTCLIVVFVNMRLVFLMAGTLDLEFVLKFRLPRCLVGAATDIPCVVRVPLVIWLIDVLIFLVLSCTLVMGVYNARLPLAWQMVLTSRM
ncbi:unnamed protein product [Prorocentrum cordatum]|uniref:Glycerophosphocholine acyltransferase 1 n=1 Tax=Prorocentrum cordatum TaxID=2364126 RepID=A0ABN9SW37_9DINO|nr:unnamed protein product [Polarella glacialis]